MNNHALQPLSEHPLVSVITPSFNQEKYLSKTIQSVLTQDYPFIEYIVIDGGSSDNSAQIIEGVQNRLAYWVSEKDKGQTDAINKGFAKATGEIIAWLNSDDTYEPGAISAMVETFKKNQDCGFIYGDCNFINAEGAIIGKFNAKQTDLKRLRAGYVHIPQQAFFFRGELWQRVAPLDDSIYFAMDYDLWLRLAELAPLRYIPGRPWANFRLHEDAKTIAADDRCWQDMLKIHRRNGGSQVSLLMLKYLVRKVLAPVVRYRRRKMISG